MLGSFGYGFIADELSPAASAPGESKAARLFPAAHLVHGRRRHRAGPDRTWLTTEHPTAEGKLCLRVVNDVCSNCIAGYSMNDGRRFQR